MSNTKAADVSIHAVAPESMAGASAAGNTVGMAIIPSKNKSARGVIFISNRSIRFKEECSNSGQNKLLCFYIQTLYNKASGADRRRIFD
jgi:hypothetical protein